MASPVLGPNGLPLIIGDSAPAIAEDPCDCCDGLQDCPGCPDRTPLGVTLTIAGMVNMGCDDCANINGTYYLPVAATCRTFEDDFSISVGDGTFPCDAETLRIGLSVLAGTIQGGFDLLVGGTITRRYGFAYSGSETTCKETIENATGTTISGPTTALGAAAGDPCEHDGVSAWSLTY